LNIIILKLTYFLTGKILLKICMSIIDIQE